MQAVTNKGLLDVMARGEERVLFQVGAQPPARAVCQRLLKPRPSVYLVVPPLEDPSSSSSSSPSSSASASSSSSAEGESLRRLYAALDSTTPSRGVFVVASVVRLDSGALVPHAIDGQSTLRLQKCDWHEGVYKATFDKMKLTVTSSQCHGTKFALHFRLHCRSLDLGDLASLTVASSPIEVFSHLQYLAQAQEIEKAVNSVKGRGRDQLPDGQGEQTEGTCKHAGNGVGLQLKIMQLIHAYRAQGGDEASLHESVTAIFTIFIAAILVVVVVTTVHTDATIVPSTFAIAALHPHLALIISVACACAFTGVAAHGRLFPPGRRAAAATSHL